MISIKSLEEIQIMAEGGKILAKIMAELKEMVKPGIKTRELDRAAEALIFKYKAEPAFKDYGGFPAALCVCINEEVVHCVPSARILKQGDIISLDLGLKYPVGLNDKNRSRRSENGSRKIIKSFYVDMAITVPVGQVSPEAQRLIRATKKALKRAIKKIRPGNTVGDIGNTVQRYVEGQGFSVVKELCGHGIGRKLHEEPQILNYGKRRKGEKLKQGMVLCPEPMAAVGRGDIEKLKDGHGFKTKDNSLSAHFEHTVAVTEGGCQVLTKLR